MIVALPARAAPAAAWSLLGQWVYPGTLTASVLFTGLGAAHDLMVECVDVTTDVAASIQFLVSSDNGNTFATVGYRRTSAATGGRTSDVTGILTTSGITAARNPWAIIETWGAALDKIVNCNTGNANGTSQLVIPNVLNAIKLLPSTGNFNGGTINIYAR